jgi:hypothetical protein
VSNIIGSVPNGKRTWDGVPLTKEPPRNIKPFHYPLPPPSGSRAGCPSVGPSREPQTVSLSFTTPLRFTGRMPIGRSLPREGLTRALFSRRHFFFSDV